MPLPTGFFSTQQPLPNTQQPPEFQSVAERDAWYRANGTPHNNAANAPAFQPTNPNDPYYQRSDIAPFIQATNRDVLGGGKFGIRGWTLQHPVGTMAALLALTAAGGVAGGAGAGGAAGGGAGGGGIGSGLGSAVGEGFSAGVGEAVGGSAGGAFGSALGAGAAGAGTGAAAGGWGNSSGQLTMGNASDYGAANHGLVLDGGAGTGVPSWLSSAGQYADQFSGLLGGGQQGGGGSGYAMPAMPSGGFMGSQAPAMQGRKQSQPLSQARLRFRGYQRTPMNFNGTTIWV